MTEGEYKKNIADFIKEMAPGFERSSIITELELENQDYSFSDIKELYENGIGALGSLSFEGDALDALRVCTVGYSVLMRLGIGKDEYIEWAERQGAANVYILERVVGIIDKAWEAAFVTIYVNQKIMDLRSDNTRAMLTPTDEASVLSLFGHNVVVTEKMLTYLDVKRELVRISENAVKQFETEYNTSINNFASLQKNLMMVMQDTAESALDEIRKYLEKKECESQFEFIEKKYLDMVAENSPYTLMLEGLEQICNQYQSKAVKNEVDRLRRESRHFVGGGFGIRGFVAGVVMAKVANSAAGAFNGAVNGINNWLNDTRMRSNLDKLANAPKQRQMYKESIQKSILALEDVFCDVLCPADSMEERMDEAFQGFCQEITLPPMLLKASPSELQEVIYLSLLKQPFTGYLKVAFDIFGDKNNELEILAGCTGQTDFLKYKYKKQEKKDEEIPHFPLLEELISNKEVICFLQKFTEIKKAIQGGEWSYEMSSDMIEGLHTAYAQMHTNVPSEVPSEYRRVINCYLQSQEEEILQMLQKSFLNMLTEIKKVIQGGEWSYDIADDIIEKLHTAYVQVHTNVPTEYRQIFNSRLQSQEEEMLQMLQKTVCVVEDRSYVNYFDAYLMIGYAERFEDIYTKYTLDFVRDFSNNDFDKRKQYLLKLKNKPIFLKDYFALSSGKFQNHVSELLEKIDFVKYMSKNPAIRGGKEDYVFSALFQKRFKGLLETAKTLPSQGNYEWGKYVQGGIWSNDILNDAVVEYDYRYKNEDVRKMIGEPCGQYILLHHKYTDSESGKRKSLVLTDQFLYVGEKKFSLQKLTTISNYVSMDGRERKIFLHLGEEKIQVDKDLFGIDSLIPQFYNTIRHAMPDFDNEPKYPIVIVKCLKCGSHEIKLRTFGPKCKACGASESILSKEPKIGWFDAYGPFRDRTERAFKYAEETSYDKWCRELME